MVKLHSIEEVKGLFKKQSVRLGIILAMAVIIISLLQTTAVTNTLKLGGEESDYIWYCTHQTEWKEADYKKI